MKTKWKVILISLLACAAIIIVAYISASPPPSPTLPSESVTIPSGLFGPSAGYVGQELEFKTGGSISNAGYRLKYIFDWGDGTYTETEFADSGQDMEATHEWDSTGTYYIKIRAQGETGVFSNWSSGKRVVIERVQHEEVIGTLRDYKLPGQHHYYWSEYIQAEYELSISWEADGAVSVYILTETQYDNFKVFGYTSRYIAFHKASHGTLSRVIQNADTYYIVIHNSSLLEIYKIYSAEVKLTW